jgi:hypothetical protein
MAKTKKTPAGRQMSRRQMVMVLGSGVVFAGTVKGEDFASEAQGNVCAAVKPLTTRVGNRFMLVADPCCEEGFEIVHASFGGSAAKKTTKEHLKVFHDALHAAKQDDLLLEYCVMMWGLTKPDAEGLVVKMKEQYNLQDYAPVKK